ncbi:SH3 domain-containing protein [Alcanivorax sp. 1008]|uniref:SH3 domain-containing protein n=1 Tax=Alcanivorax sp. 1008 TaxID=2816853 RepID=UPI001D7B3648|nr:SH3 domain-containing protein [Alcanivorax sp. 1008]MCC1496803.1 SH3 domain-containing protein [Alcanivorax sp. 1008]
MSLTVFHITPPKAVAALVLSFASAITFADYLSPESAMPTINALVEKGYPSGLYQRGLLVQAGTVDEALAPLEAFLLAASAGSHEAAVIAGALAIKDTPTLALSLFVKAAAQGNSEGAYRAAKLVEEQPGIEWISPLPQVSAADLYHLAALGSGEYATRACGLLGYRALARSRPEVAVDFLRCAALNGEPSGSFNYAMALLSLPMTTASYQEALNHLGRAADADIPRAGFVLGSVLLRGGKGFGVDAPPDFIGAAKWLSMAESSGDPYSPEAGRLKAEAMAAVEGEALALDLPGASYTFGAEPIYGEVKAVNLNVRSGPSTDYELVATLPQGTRMRILRRVGSWYQAIPSTRPAEESPAMFGWVFAGCVKVPGGVKNLTPADLPKCPGL